VVDNRQNLYKAIFQLPNSITTQFTKIIDSQLIS